MHKYDESDSEIVEERMSQGTRYEGKDSDHSETEEQIGDNEEEENHKLGKISLDFKNPKMLIIGAIALIAIVAVIALFVVNGKSKGGLSGDDLYPDTSETEEPIDEIVFSYTNEEIEKLRLAGYTGDEIEQFAYEERDANELIKEAEDKRQAQYDEEIKPYFAGASDKFKKMWNDSWVGQDKLSWNKDESTYEYYTERFNLDYKKLDPTGHQLFLKLTLPDGSAGFMTVAPERYVQLKAKGNINVEVSYTQSSDRKYIITSITEISITE